MAKSPDAFRTISEVSAFLETPPHVLRFWESKFPQVKPVKRAGGRRYYRPDDITLLGGIKVLLHEQGMTIRGVQKMLREQGVRHVSGLAPPSLSPGWAEQGEDGAAVDGVSGGVPEGVILGPWVSQPAERELDDEVADLAAEDGLTEEELAGIAPEDEAFDGTADDEEEALALEAAQARDGGAEAPSLVEAFVRGTVGRFAAESAALAPSGPITLERALELARRADPAKLRARAERIAPLLHRLRELRAGPPGR